MYEIGQSNSNDLVSLTEQNCGVSLNGIQNNISLEDTEAAACPIESPKPKVKIINHGTNTITSVKLELFEGESTTPIDEVVWEGNLTPFEEDFAEFSTISNFNPEAEYLALASDPNNVTDANDALNQATIYVTNMLGKKVIELNNFNTNIIDISSLDKGIYSLNTNLNGKLITEKFVTLK